MIASEVPLLIVGGGVAGCSLAFALARRGIGAELVESGRIGDQGASAVAAALLNPYRGRSAKPGRYDLAGLAAFWQMCDVLEDAGFDHGARRSGVLRVASSDRQANAWRKIAGLDEFLDLPAPYRAPNGAFLVGAGGWVEPARLLAALKTWTSRRRSSFVEGCTVERLEAVDGQWLAHTEGGGVIRARNVALCLGAGSVAGAPLPPLQLIVGDQITLRSDARLPYPLAGSIYLASDGGRVFIGGNHREPGTDDPQAPELLRASAARMAPPLAGATIERVWTGVRAKQPGNQPILRELEPGLWYLGAFGGRGFLTAPLLAGRLAAQLNS
ncbi:MAG: FAD-dependent oxidoreductase [Trueperaceae bacterium]